MYVDDIEMAGKKADYGSHVEEVYDCLSISENQHHFLTHVYLMCTQRERTPEDIIFDECRMFESRISAGGTEELPGWENPHENTVAWSYDMEGLAPKCVERSCEMANKKDSSCTKSQLFFWMPIISRRRNWNQWENGQRYPHRFSSTCMYLFQKRWI